MFLGKKFVSRADVTLCWAVEYVALGMISIFFDSLMAEKNLVRKQIFQQNNVVIKKGPPKNCAFLDII